MWLLKGQEGCCCLISRVWLACYYEYHHHSGGSPGSQMKSVTMTARMAFARTLSLAALSCQGCWDMGAEYALGRKRTWIWCLSCGVDARLFHIPAGCLQVEGQDRGMHALAELVLLMSLSRVEPGLQRRAESSGLHSLPGFHNQGLDSSYRALLLVRTAKVSKQILPWVDHFCMTPLA